MCFTRLIFVFFGGGRGALLFYQTISILKPNNINQIYHVTNYGGTKRNNRKLIKSTTDPINWKYYFRFLL